MSDATSIIKSLYLKKSEPKNSFQHDEVTPIVPEPFILPPPIPEVKRIMPEKPKIVAAALACQRRGITQRRSGVLDLSQVLNAWYEKRGSAVQLNGRRVYKNSPGAWVYFDFKGLTYKLAGDTKDFAVKRFLDLVLRAQDPDSVLIIATGKKGNPVLRLAGESEAEGWYCTSS